MSTTTTNPDLLPVVSISATQKMRHANAFGGNETSVTFGTGTNGWGTTTGTEIEVWSQGYGDLLARRGSAGLGYTFSQKLGKGIYYLKWMARGRWPEDTTGAAAENKYIVKIFSGETLVVSDITRL